MKKDSFYDICNFITDCAKRNGAKHTIVSATNYLSTEIQVRKGKTDYIDHSMQQFIDLNIFINGKYSSHTINLVDKNKLQQFIKQAVEMTKFLNPDPAREITDPSLYPQNPDENPEIYDPEFDSLTVDEMIQNAKEIEASALSVEGDIISATASWTCGKTEKLIIHSNGFEGTRNSTFFSVSAEVTSSDEKNNTKPEGYSSATTRFKKDLPLWDTIGKDASERALKKHGQKKINSGKYALIVENRSVSRILSGLFSALNAGNIYNKNSFLSDKRNSLITCPVLTVTDDPLLKRGLGSRLFDSDGIKSQKRTIIENGICREFYVNFYYSKKTGLYPTTGRPSNILMNTGNKTPEQMIKSCDSGIFVTNFIGGNTNLTTGDFSMGIQGFLIENGELSKPVNEMNISGNLLDFWKNLVEIGNDPFPYSSVRCPSCMFDNIDISGL